MENASKALIIAGAILLSIIIVSLGIVVINNARNSMKNANLDDMEIQAFNSKFTGLTGTSVNGQTINAAQLYELIDKVRVSNLEENQTKSNKFVKITGSYTKTDNKTTQTFTDCGTDASGNYKLINMSSYNNISSAKKYLVKPTFASSGIISSITVSSY